MRYLILLAACGRSAPTAEQLDAAHPIDARAIDAAVPQTSVELKIVTFNLLHGFPSFENLEQRTDIVVDWINTVQPDLLALQEAAQTATMMNRGEIIAQRTGYHWAWTKAAGVPGVFEEGPGVLSRAPIAASEGIQLPHVVNTFGVRSATRAEVDTAAGRVAMVSMHLGGDSPPDVVINADQATAAESFLMASAATTHLLGGDTNATPDEPGMVYLRGQLDDAWQTANPSDPGLTDPVPTAMNRIDYLYVERSVQVLACELLFTAPVNGIYASDHFGVMCTVRIHGV